MFLNDGSRDVNIMMQTMIHIYNVWRMLSYFMYDDDTTKCQSKEQNIQLYLASVVELLFKVVVCKPIKSCWIFFGNSAEVQWHQTFKMVLADLGNKISGALNQMATAVVIDEKVVDKLVSCACSANLVSNECFVVRRRELSLSLSFKQMSMFSSSRSFKTI